VYETLAELGRLGVTVKTLPVLLNMEQVADLLGLTVPTVRQWNRQGKLPQPRRVGQGLRWSGSDIAAWLRGCPMAGAQ